MCVHDPYQCFLYFTENNVSNLVLISVSSIEPFIGIDCIV